MESIVYLIPLVIFPLVLVAIEYLVKSQLKRKIKESEYITREMNCIRLEHELRNYKRLGGDGHTKAIVDSIPPAPVVTTKPAAMICSQCGAPLDNHYHCSYCGTNFSASGGKKPVDKDVVGTIETVVIYAGHGNQQVCTFERTVE